MASIELAEFQLSDPETGLNVTIFDVDPETYDPFNLPIRGNSFQAVDGSVINQVFGTYPADMTVDVSGEMLQDTVRAIWTKYINKGKVWRLQDWMGNKFNVIFRPGVASFHPIPIRGSCEKFQFTINLQVCEIIEWFGSAYG